MSQQQNLFIASSKQPSDQAGSQPDRGISFGKALSLNVAKQASSSSNRPFETNKLFESNKQQSDYEEGRISERDRVIPGRSSEHLKESESNFNIKTRTDSRERLNNNMKDMQLKVNSKMKTQHLDRKPQFSPTKGNQNNFQAQMTESIDQIEELEQLQLRRKTSNSQLAEIPARTFNQQRITPNDKRFNSPKSQNDPGTGFKSSVLSFLRLDGFFKQGETSKDRQISQKPLTKIQPPKGQQTISSTQQIIQKKMYQSNLIDHEDEVEDYILAPSGIKKLAIPKTEPVSLQSKNFHLSRQASLGQDMGDHQQMSFLQKNTFNQQTVSPFSIENKVRHLRSQKESEITIIRAVNPLNSKQVKTVFKSKTGPSMQIEFKNKQQRKEIQQETVTNQGSSDDQSAMVPGSMNSHQRKLEKKMQINSSQGIRTLHYSRDSRASDFTSGAANQLSHRSKQQLQQLDKIQRNDSDPEENAINMTSEDEDFRSPHDQKVVIYSELTTPLYARESESHATKTNDDQLQQEYERLQAELLSLKRSKQPSPSRYNQTLDGGVQRSNNVQSSPRKRMKPMTQSKISKYGREPLEEGKRQEKKPMKAHNRSQMPTEYEMITVHKEKRRDSVQQRSEAQNILASGRLVGSSGVGGPIWNKRNDHRGIEFDVKSLNSRLDLKTQGISKVKDNSEYDFVGRRTHRGQLALSTIQDTHGNKRKDGKQSMREELSRKQQIMQFKKSFLSDHERTSEGGGGSRHAKNYSASASSNEPADLEALTNQFRAGQPVHRAAKSTTRDRSQRVTQRERDPSAPGNYSRMHHPTEHALHIKAGMGNISQIHEQPSMLSLATPLPVNYGQEMYQQPNLLQEYQVQISNLQSQIIQMQNQSMLTQHARQQSATMNNSLLNGATFGAGSNINGFMPTGNPLYGLNNSHFMMGQAPQQMQMQLSQPHQPLYGQFGQLAHNQYPQAPPMPTGSQPLSTQQLSQVQQQYQETIKELKAQLQEQQQQITQMHEESVPVPSFDGFNNAERIMTQDDRAGNQAASQLQNGVAHQRSRSETRKKATQGRYQNHDDEYNQDETLAIEDFADDLRAGRVGLEEDEREEKSEEHDMQRQGSAVAWPTERHNNESELPGRRYTIDDKHMNFSDERPTSAPRDRDASQDVKVSENYKKSIMMRKQSGSRQVLDPKRARASIKNALKQTAGFPSMLDSGIQGINFIGKHNIEDHEKAVRPFEDNDEETIAAQDENSVTLKSWMRNVAEGLESVTDPAKFGLKEGQPRSQAQGHLKSYEEIQLGQEEEKYDVKEEEEDKSGLIIIGFDEQQPLRRNPLDRRKRQRIVPSPMKHKSSEREAALSQYDVHSPRIISQNENSKPSIVVNETRVVNNRQHKLKPVIEIGESSFNQGSTDKGQNFGPATSRSALQVFEMPNFEAKSDLKQSDDFLVSWPSKGGNKPDKTNLLISDDMPNLQEVFLKNKMSVSVTNRRSRRPQGGQGLLILKTAHDLDSKRIDRGHKSPSPRPGQKLEINDESMGYDAESSLNTNALRRQKTKAELAEIRRQMMRRKVKGAQMNQTELRSENSRADVPLSVSGDNRINLDMTIISGANQALAQSQDLHGQGSRGSKTLRNLPQSEKNLARSPKRARAQDPTGARPKPPDHDILVRLASGQKGVVDHKAMKRLTAKNFEKLPEVRKKKEAAAREQEMILKKERTVKFQKELDARLRLGRQKKQVAKDQETHAKKQTTTISKQTKITETMETVTIASGENIQIVKNKKKTNVQEQFSS